MSEEVKMKTVKVGVCYESYGYINVEVPSKLRSRKAILEYLDSISHELPLPDDPNYVDDTYEIDSVNGLCRFEIDSM